MHGWLVDRAARGGTALGGTALGWPPFGKTALGIPPLAGTWLGERVLVWAAYATLAGFAAAGGLAGCGSEPSSGSARPALDGGAAPMPACGWDLVTRRRASKPTPGEAVFGPDPTPHRIHLGLVGDPARSIAIQWRTRDETTRATTVQYGVGDTLDRTAEGLTFVYATEYDLDDAPLVRVHEVHLCGLEPDTEYSYRVGGVTKDGVEHWSEPARFRTAPETTQPDAEVVILGIGDTRGAYGKWGEMLSLAHGMHAPDLILFSGDAVGVGEFQSEWDEWYAAAEPVLRRVPLVSAHGNHEVNAIHYYAQAMLPGNEEWFSFDYGPLHAVVLNDTPADEADLMGRQAAFLDADLAAAAGAPWTIVMHHKPQWSASNHGGQRDLRAAWGSIIDAHGVDLVLNGHDHNYERTKPLRGGVVQASPTEGTTYVVAGSAGAPLYSAGEGFWTALSEKTYNFIIVRARRGMLDLRAYRDDGSLLDSLTIVKP